MSHSTPRRTFLVLCLTLAATLATTTATPVRAVSPPEPPKGLSAPPQATPMPVFELPVANGTTMRSTDLRDKVTVIRFWATW
jgi:hypothetical protein